MVAEIYAGIGAFKAMFDMAKGLKDIRAKFAGFESEVDFLGFSKPFGSASLSRMIRGDDDAEALFAGFA